MNKLTILLGEDTKFLLSELNSSKFDDSWRFPFPEVRDELPLSHAEQQCLTNKLIENLQVCSKIVLCTHSEIIFYTIRLAVFKKKLQPFEVDIRWFAKNKERSQVNIDSDGRLSHEPAGMFDVQIRILADMLDR